MPFSTYFQSKRGTIYLGDSLEFMREALEAASVDLIMTSPPFGLVRKKTYGNVDADKYVDWFRPFGEEFKRVLKPSGSLVIDIGGAWIPGQPTRSLYHFELLLMLCKSEGQRRNCRRRPPGSTGQLRRKRRRPAPARSQRGPIWLAGQSLCARERSYDNGLIFLDERYVMRLNPLKEMQLTTLHLDGGIVDFKSVLDKEIHLPADRQQWPAPALIRKANEFRRIPT